MRITKFWEHFDSFPCYTRIRPANGSEPVRIAAKQTTKADLDVIQPETDLRLLGTGGLDLSAKKLNPSEIVGKILKDPRKYKALDSTDYHAQTTLNLLQKVQDFTYLALLSLNITLYYRCWITN